MLPRIGRPARVMTLEEYRIQLVQRIRDCSSPAEACSLIGEGDLVLAQSQLSERTQRLFWSNLHADLEVLREDLIGVPERAGRSVRGAVLVAAQVAITQHQNALAGTAASRTSQP